MFKRAMLSYILICFVLYIVSVNEAKKKKKVRFGPKGISFKHSTSCATFSNFSRFNPYSVINERWFVFFYWASPRPMQSYAFTVPTANHTKFLHQMFDGKVTIPVNWTARLLLMHDAMDQKALLVERNDRGQYWAYQVLRIKNDTMPPRKVCFRQVDNGRLLGFMECASETLFVMSRINEIPPQSKLQEEAARFGFRGRRGKSYLYQGHEWMPIPEADERLLLFSNASYKNS